MSDNRSVAAAFEQQAAETVAAGRAGRFELPDYYVVLTPGAGPSSNDDAARLTSQ